jgi:DNA-binding MarR family transcriptional regulator
VARRRIDAAVLTIKDDEAHDMPTPFTAKQGQYLAFIYYYSKIHGVPPAEADFRRFFRVTPPVVHQMIKTLHAHGFIDREPGKARSIRLRLTRAELPDLD